VPLLKSFEQLKLITRFFWQNKRIEQRHESIPILGRAVRKDLLSVDEVPEPSIESIRSLEVAWSASEAIVKCL
jgi:hypothetical protein